MNTKTDARTVDDLRRFNRFYTRRIGVLNEGLLATPFTLTQARVLFEIATHPGVTAGEIADALALDLGYLSRILQEFVSTRLVSRRKSRDDGRRVLLKLTAAGRRAFQDLDARSRDQVAALLEPLPDSKRTRLFTAINEIQTVLSEPGAGAHAGEILVRTHRLGDIGWAIEQHARIYAEEFGWNEEFEALVAKLFADFAIRHDPSRECMWVAERSGERVGCVFVVQNEDDHELAQLRCLLVDPQARGYGIGRRLVAECVQFARSTAYRGVVLWTNDVLVSARRLYEDAGFVLVNSEPHHSFGHDLVGQVWRLDFS